MTGSGVQVRAADEMERRVRKMKARNGHKKFEKIRAMLPKKLSDAAKIEIVSMVLEALLRRSYRGKRLYQKGVRTHIKNFVSDYYKDNPAMAFGKIDSPWSLDDTVPGTEGLRRIDTVSEGMW
jgi:hypothetical protein